MALQTRYITVDEFTEYFGINLEEELRDTSNPSNKVNAFLKRVEDRMEVFLNANFFKNVSELWSEFSDFQKYHYKLALLEQAYYIFKNGDISTDSGYDPDKGTIIDKEVKKGITLADNAINHLQMIGLWSRHINHGGIFWPWVM